MFKKKITQRALLLCHPRSGSNALTSILNRHPDLHFYAQIFKNNEGVRRHFDDLGVIPYYGTRFIDDIDERDHFRYLEEHPEERGSTNVVEFLDSFYEKAPKEYSRRMIGFKMLGGTLYSEDLKKCLQHANYKVLLLHRENLLQAAVSWHVARLQNQWVVQGKTEAKVPEEPLNIEDLRWFMENSLREIHAWKNLLEELSINYFEMIYENIFSSNTIRQIWNFLGLPEISYVDPTTNKIMSNDKYRAIPNLDEIDRILGSPRLGYLQEIGKP